jgi:hypothetical protein
MTGCRCTNCRATPLFLSRRTYLLPSSHSHALILLLLILDGTRRPIAGCQPVWIPRGRAIFRLHDEDNVDGEGAIEDLERIGRSWRPSHVVVGGGVDQNSDSLKCERSYGPSDVEDGGGDTLQGLSCFRGDRSSPVQSERFRAREGPSQC